MDPSMLPMGYTFCPTDEELLGYYLYSKVSGQQAPPLELAVIDLYTQEPSQIWQQCKGVDNQYIYFFTTLKKKKSRIIRKVGSNGGTWSGENKPQQVFSSIIDNLLLGTMKRFRYEKSKATDDCTWIMYEYTLHPSIVSAGLVHDSYVLCMIRKKIVKSEKRVVMTSNKRQITSSDWAITSMHVDNQIHKRIRLEEETAVDLQKECQTHNCMRLKEKAVVDLQKEFQTHSCIRLKEKTVVYLQKECCIDATIGCITTQMESCFQGLSNDDDLIFAKENEKEIEQCNNLELSNVEDGLSYDNEWYFRPRSTTTL